MKSASLNIIVVVALMTSTEAEIPVTRFVVSPQSLKATSGLKVEAALKKAGGRNEFGFSILVLREEGEKFTIYQFDPKALSHSAFQQFMMKDGDRTHVAHRPTFADRNSIPKPWQNVSGLAESDIKWFHHGSDQRRE